jgi:Pectate lyase superfamily protein
MSWNFAGQWGGDSITDPNGSPLALTLVNVYISGTTTLATLYTDRTMGTTTSNPTLTDANGNLTFFATPGVYDIVGSGANLVTVEVQPDEADTDGRLGALNGSVTSLSTQVAGLSVGTISVKTYGAVGDGVVDDTSAIQQALNNASFGQIVYMPPGKYATSSPLLIPPGVSFEGPSFTRTPYSPAAATQGATIYPAATFSTSGSIPSAVIVIVDQTTGGYSVYSEAHTIKNLYIDGSRLPAGGNVDGVQVYGAVAAVKFIGLSIYSVSGCGINTVHNSSGYPDALNGTDVFVYKSGLTGFSLSDCYGDMVWTRCHALASGSYSAAPGWGIKNSANSTFSQCKGEWSSQHGFYVEMNASGNGSGGLSFVNCSTDRNSTHGVYVTGTGHPPITFTGGMFRRDGRATNNIWQVVANGTQATYYTGTGPSNPEAAVLYTGHSVTVSGLTPSGCNITGTITATTANTFTVANTVAAGTYTTSGTATDAGNTYAGIHSESCTAPVFFVNCSVFPGTDDNGTGPLTPYNGALFTSSNVVVVNSCYVQGATTSVVDAGSNTTLSVSRTIQATGSTSGPTLNPSGAVNLTAQGAAISSPVVFFSPTIESTVTVNYMAQVTRAATSSSVLGGAGGLVIAWTTPDGTSQSFATGAGPSGNTTTTITEGQVIMRVKAGTNVTYTMGYTSSGATSMQYALYLKAVVN